MPGTLSVSLSGTLVGSITNIPGDYNVFAFDPAYAADPNRPILSQSFIDASQQLIRIVPRTQTIAPSFFSNLLPEPGSLLRSIIARQRAIDAARDFPFLAVLGSDLPGAVIVSGTDERPEPIVEPNDRATDGDMLRFSLAGMHLKFSASMADDGAAWIVKMPTNAYPRLPENEYAMMRLAAAIGLDVPEIALRDVESMDALSHGIPGLRSEERFLYAIRRFDRSVAGRVHVEDFNQITAQKSGPEKYENKSTAYIGKVLSQLCEHADVGEFVRRVTFGILIGNGDMHLKNWAVVYPDGRHAKIAPLYDFVCTRRYLPSEDLALTIGGERRFENVTRDTMRIFAEQAELSAREVLRLVDDTCERVRSKWPALRESVADVDLVRALDGHLASLPLFTYSRSNWNRPPSP